MRRQVVRTINGEIVHTYEDCGPSKARKRPGLSPVQTIPGGHRLGECLFAHPASEVTKLPHEKVSR
jgi:hypothetical protein